MRSMLNDCSKHLEKHAKGLLFPIFPAMAVFALKVWENLKKITIPSEDSKPLLLLTGYMVS